jgi:hypothetical protein
MRPSIGQRLLRLFVCVTIAMSFLAGVVPDTVWADDPEVSPPPPPLPPLRTERLWEPVTKWTQSSGRVSSSTYGFNPGTWDAQNTPSPRWRPSELRPYNFNYWMPPVQATMPSPLLPPQLVDLHISPLLGHTLSTEFLNNYLTMSYSMVHPLAEAGFTYGTLAWDLVDIGRVATGRAPVTDLPGAGGFYSRATMPLINQAFGRSALPGSGSISGRIQDSTFNSSWWVNSTKGTWSVTTIDRSSHRSPTGSFDYNYTSTTINSPRQSLSPPPLLSPMPGRK